jgi:hypothetical protein
MEPAPGAGGRVTLLRPVATRISPSPVVALLRGRYPFSVTVAALTFAFAAVTLPAYRQFPLVAPQGWLSPLIVALLFAVVGSSVLIALGAALSGVAGGHSYTGAFGQAGGVRGPNVPAVATRAASVRVHPSRLVIRGQHVVRVLLVGLVLVETLSHTGERSGWWATGLPRAERDTSTADGNGFWLDGVPQMEDSRFFVTAVAAVSEEDRLDEIDGWVRSGRTGYVALVALLARVTAAFGGVYPAVLAVGVVFWALAVLAMDDLGRRATGSRWGGLFAGALTATGIGFTFTIGQMMPTAAAYGGVAIVVWLLERLGVFSAGGRLRDVCLTSAVAAGVSTLNSLAPVFLLFVFFSCIGRAALHRLLIWAAVLYGAGALWKRGLEASGAGFGGGLPTAAAALAGAAAVLILVLAARWPRLTERFTALLALCGAAGVVVAIVFASAQVSALITRTADTLNLPEYILGRVGAMNHAGNAGGADVAGVLEGFRAAFFDDNVFGAFPFPLVPLALLGLVGLPRRWVDWCVAGAVAAGLVAFAMNAVTGSPHPRLVYNAYPAVYLAAANGLLNAFRGSRTVLTGLARAWKRERDAGTSPVQRAAAAVSTGVVVALVLWALVPSHASLWGDWSYERWHGASDASAR